MAPPPSLQDLIAGIHRDAPSEDALVRLRTAASFVSDVTDTADAVLGHFVDQARRAGHSWSEIGESLGVSKQAAQQRHVARSGISASTLTQASFARLTDRARNVVALSEAVARDMGYNYVGTEHLLLAQFSVPEGFAGQVLLEAGLTAASVRVAIVDESGRGPGAPDTKLPFTPQAVEALTAALTVALELGHNYIGTEHQLLGLFRTDGLAVRILENAGLPENVARTRLMEKLDALLKARGEAPAPPATQAPKARPAAKKRPKA